MRSSAAGTGSCPADEGFSAVQSSHPAEEKGVLRSFSHFAGKEGFFDVYWIEEQ